MSWSSGTNVIKEVSTNKSLTLQMLELKKQGGGTEYFLRKSDVTLGTKNITANGTYKASSDSKYGFSQVTVNVRGAAGSAGSDGKPNTSGSTKPGGAGSAVVGTDPETGNDVAVGVDENGNLVQTPVPSGIEIITPPTKTSYVYQETMDYSGIVVAAKKKDGTTFTDARYTNGHIPMGELIFPVTEAPAGSGEQEASSAISGLLTQPIKFISGSSVHENVITTEHGLRHSESHVNAPDYVRYFVVVDGNMWRWYFCSSQQFTVNFKYYLTFPDPSYNHVDESSASSSAELYNGVNVHRLVSSADHSQDIPSGTVITVPMVNGTGANIADLWTVAYGSISGGTATIPVKWNNPYTGDMHQDTFDITSTPSSGSSSTTTGSSGTEGSGGGGSF